MMRSPFWSVRSDTTWQSPGHITCAATGSAVPVTVTRNPRPIAAVRRDRGRYECITHSFYGIEIAGFRVDSGSRVRRWLTERVLDAALVGGTATVSARAPREPPDIRLEMRPQLLPNCKKTVTTP